MPETESVEAPPAAGLGPAHRGRILVVALAVLTAVAVAAGLSAYLGRPKQHAGVTTAAFALTPGHLTYRSTLPGPDLGKVVELPFGTAGAAAATTPTVSRVACERSYTAAGELLCLESDGALVSTEYAYLYDSALHQTQKLQITGLPSRARLSADGRMAAWTTFVTGDSYVGPAFSTRASILDTRTGTYVDSLETFTAFVDGKPYKAVDTNYWGVTFTGDDTTFYATMSSDNQTWLVRGDFAARTLTAIRGDVECPSLSPDGTRLVFKKRVSDDVRKPWHLAVLDLRTMKETLLAESRSVDDQAAWLDDHTVMYGVAHADQAGSDVWSVPADGGGSPVLLARDAESPSITTG